MVEVSFEKPFSNYFEDPNILENHSIIVFDTETTGLDTRIPHVQIISLSAAAFDINSQKMVDVFNKFAELNPETVQKQQSDQRYNAPGAPKFSYIDEFLKQAKWDGSEKHGSELQVVDDFVGFVKKFHNPLLVGYNSGFDMRMINSVLKKNGRKPLKVPVVDVMKMVHVFVEPTLDYLAKQGKMPDSEEKQLAAQTANKMIAGITNQYGKRSLTLGNIASMFNVLQAGAHVSINDIEMTGKVLVSAMNFIKDHQKHLESDYLDVEKDARSNYQQKMDYFNKIHPLNYRKHNKKNRAIELVKKDVFQGVQSFVDTLKNDLRKEKMAARPNIRKMDDINASIMKLNDLLKDYQGDDTEIIKFIYNY